MANPILHNTPINDQNIIVQTSYDKADRMTNLRDPRGNLTAYEYDQLDRRTKRTNPLNTQWTTLYENLPGGGTRTSLTYPGVNGGSSYTVQKDFDRLGRPTAINYGDIATTPTVNFTYDSAGDRTKMSEFGTSGKTRETTFSYDEGHRMGSAGFDDDGNNTIDQTVSYTYDLGGLRTQLTLPDGKTVTYVYDKKGNLQQFNDWQTPAQSSILAYDGVNRPNTIQRANNIKSQYTFDPASRLTTLRHFNTVSNATLAQFDYQVDALGNRTQAQAQFGTGMSWNWSYGYDNVKRLSTAAYSTIPRHDYSYNYDLAGNRLSVTQVDNDFVQSTIFSYDAANRLTDEWNLQGHYQYTYDLNGNLLSNNGTDTYTWDRANRLKTLNGTSYQYDGNGNRIRQMIGSTVTNYLIDLQPALPTVLTETTGMNIIRYLHAPHGLHMQQDASNNYEWMLFDGLGSIRAVVSNTGSILETREYDPYGNPIGTSTQTPYGFTGEPTDSNGLLYLRARYYHPHLGVFPSLDPFEGTSDRPMSMNGYSYVEGNPVNWTDPTGEQCDSRFGVFCKDGGSGSGGAISGSAGMAEGLAALIAAWLTGIGLASQNIGGNIAHGLDDLWNNVCVPALKAALQSCGDDTNCNMGQLIQNSEWYQEQSQTDTQAQTQAQDNTQDDCSYEKIKQRIGGRTVAQVVGDVGNIRNGEGGYFKGSPPDGRIPGSISYGVVGKAMNICKNGDSTKYSDYYVCAPGVDCKGFRILSEGNGEFVARRLMGQPLAHIEQYIRPSPSIFAVLETQKDADFWLRSKYDWQNQKWKD